MTRKQITELERISVRLNALADECYDEDGDWNGNPSRSLRSASYKVSDAVAELRKQTSMAVGDMVQTACHENGVVGAMPYQVLRERRAA